MPKVSSAFLKPTASQQPAYDGLRAQENLFLPTRQVRARYSISDMSVWRWQNDTKLNFPKPTIIQGRKYWKLAELIAWERVRAEAAA